MHTCSIDMRRQGDLKLPSLFLVGGYRIFFWSNELGEPIHVHVCKGAPSPHATKIWITRQGGCILAHNAGKIPQRSLFELMDIIAAQSSFIVEKWKEFFLVDDVKFYC